MGDGAGCARGRPQRRALLHCAATSGGQGGALDAHGCGSGETGRRCPRHAAVLLVCPYRGEEPGLAGDGLLQAVDGWWDRASSRRGRCRGGHLRDHRQLNPQGAHPWGQDWRQDCAHYAELGVPQAARALRTPPQLDQRRCSAASWFEGTPRRPSLGRDDERQPSWQAPSASKAEGGGPSSGGLGLGPSQEHARGGKHPSASPQEDTGRERCRWRPPPS